MAKSPMLLHLRPYPLLIRSTSSISNPNLHPILPRLRLTPLISRWSPPPALDGKRGIAFTVGNTAAEEPREEVAVGHESHDYEEEELRVEIGNPTLPVRVGMVRTGLGDQAFYLLAFIAVTTSVAFTSLVVTAIPTLFAMKRAAISLAKLSDTAREELPSTMAAIRLSGMEISDLTLELSDLSQEVAEGMNKSAKAVQAAEAGLKKMGVLARQQTISIIEEGANLHNTSIQPVVAEAAKKTSHVVGRAKKSLMNLLNPGEYKDDGDATSDRLES